MSHYPHFIPEFVPCTNSSLFLIKIANELIEFRNYLMIFSYIFIKKINKFHCIRNDISCQTFFFISFICLLIHLLTCNYTIHMLFFNISTIVVQLTKLQITPMHPLSNTFPPSTFIISSLDTS